MTHPIALKVFDPDPDVLRADLNELSNEVERLQNSVGQVSNLFPAQGAWHTSIFHADQQFQGIKLMRDAAQTGIVHGTYTPVEFDTVGYQSFVSKLPAWTTVQSSQINIPYDGIYVFGGDVRFSTASAGKGELMIGTNREDDANIGGDQPVPGFVAMGHAARTSNIGMTAVFYGSHAFHASDWLRMLVWHNNGTPDVTTAGIDNARFFLHRISDLPGSIERFTTST